MLCSVAAAEERFVASMVDESSRGLEARGSEEKNGNRSNSCSLFLVRRA